MHLILAARSTDRMNELAQELLTRHGTNCHIVTIDLAVPNAGVLLVDEITKLGVEVELLVNNAGSGLIGEIETADPEEVQRMLCVNVSTLTDLTYRLLPGMIQRGHGAVINVSSVAAFQPVAFMGAYAATKSYVLHFSEALWAEVRSKGVTVLALCPGVTDTEFFIRAGAPGWLDKHSSHSVQKVVRAALAALEKRRQYSIPGWRNYLLTLKVRFLTRRTAINESERYFSTGRRHKQFSSDDAADRRASDESDER